MQGLAIRAARSLAAAAALAWVPSGADADATEEPEALAVAPPGSGWLQPQLPMHWDAEVHRHVTHFTETRAGRQRFAQGLARQLAMQAQLGPVLEAAGLPADLLYVALVESGFDVHARSPRGALGVWQLRAPTAVAYGLRKTRSVDERRDASRATAAAARYLGELHARFGGWPLTLAAYNAGPGRVQKAMRIANSDDYDVLRRDGALPRETLSYVAKVMASAWVGANAERYGVSVAPPAEPGAAFDWVHLPPGTPLRSVARASASSVVALRGLNPALLRNVVPQGAAAYALRVPVDSGDAVLRALVVPKVGLRRRRQPLGWEPCRLPPGETLGSLAQRAGLDESGLRKANGLSEQEVAPGAWLWLPLAALHVTGLGPVLSTAP